MNRKQVASIVGLILSLICVCVCVAFAECVGDVERVRERLSNSKSFCEKRIARDVSEAMAKG